MGPHLVEVLRLSSERGSWVVVLCARSGPGIEANLNRWYPIIRAKLERAGLNRGMAKRTARDAFGSRTDLKKLKLLLSMAHLLTVDRCHLFSYL